MIAERPDGGAPGSIELLALLAPGRCGSTLAMQLLATSPAIAFDRIYPFESRYVSYFLRLARQTELPMRDDPNWGYGPMCREDLFLAGPIPFETTLTDGHALSNAALRALWQNFTEQLAARAVGPVRYYAEKLLRFAPPLIGDRIPMRRLHLVRDPRDAVVSSIAFSTKQRRIGIGPAPSESIEEFAVGYARAHHDRMIELANLQQGPKDLVVRYEDLALDLAGKARIIGDWLGLPLEPETVQRSVEQFRDHMTSASAELSIGRWRRELDPALGAEMTEILGPALNRWGYDGQ